MQGMKGRDAVLSPAGDPGRRSGLQRLAREVETIRTAVETNRHELRVFLQAEATRVLTVDERDRLRRLRWESECLRWDLVRRHQDFERLRSGGPQDQR